MASPAAQLDELIATTFDNVRPVLVDQITTEVPLLNFLNSKAKVSKDGGKRITMDVLFAFNDTVGSYDGYDLLDTTPQDGFGQAVYEWKQYAGAVTIDGRTVKLNAGSSRIIDILAAKIEQLRISMVEDLGTMFWGDGTGNSSKDFLGLDAIVDNSGTLGGIDSSTETWWKSTVVATPIDLTTIDGVSDLDSILNSLRIAKSRPDGEFTDQAGFEAYEALAKPNIRFQDLSKANLSFDTISHRSAEVFFDNDCPAGEWFFLNSQFIELVTHQDEWMSRGPFKEPVNQNAKSMQVLSMGELVTDCRRAHGRATDIVVP